MEYEIVSFDAFDLLQITMFAERQQCVKRALNVRSKKYDLNKGEFELHYIGAMGEWAVMKNYPTTVDYNVYKIGDDGIDLVIAGWDCQVKTFAYAGNNLEVFIDNMEQFKGDALIATQICSPVRVRILGCISRGKFSREAQTKNYGYGDRMFVPISLLSPIRLLVAKPKTDKIVALSQ